MQATGLRVYSEVGLGLPRKNGKSVQASAAGLYFLVADGEAEPEVYVAAAARNQAGIVLGQSRRMAQQSPRLSRHISVRTTLIECPRNGGVMRSLSADAALQHGLNPYANIIDELHAHRTADLYTALTTGTGAREQPFTLWISTAGVDAPDILVELHASMFDGPGDLEDRGSLPVYRDRANGVLIWWYGAPRDADIEDPAVWLAANPASWLRDGTYLSQEYARLRARGALLDWRRYHLNQFVGTEEAWLPEGAWTSCRVGDPDPADPLHGLDPSLPVGVGIDKGQTSDLSAIVVAQRQGERVVVRSRVFPPHPATGRVNTESMRAYLRELRGRFPLAQARDEKTGRALQGPAFAYDRWAFSESAETLEQEGLAMIDFPQNASTMGPASTQAFELITTGRLAHDGDPVLAEHVANTTAILTERGMKVTKPRRVTPRKNDAAVALVMAVAMAMQAAPKPNGLGWVARDNEASYSDHMPVTMKPLTDEMRAAVLRLAAQHGARDIRVFGSVARGEAGPESDLDLLVDFEPGRSLLDQVALTQDLETLLGRPIDVVTEDGLYWLLRRRILGEARPL